MRMRVALLFQLGMVLLCGCTTTEPPVAVEKGGAMLPQESKARAEPLPFPEYLLMANFELGQHGWIPGTNVVGADLETTLDLKTVLQQFNDLLEAEGWIIATSEVARDSFRLMASLEGDTLEIRGVQGSGVAKIFILYQPDPGTRLENP